MQPRAQGPFADPQAWRDLLGSDDPGVFSLAWLRLVAATLDQALSPLAGSETAVLSGFVAMRAGSLQRYTRTATIGAGEVSLLLAKVAERCLQLRQAVGQTHAASGSDDAPAEALPVHLAVPVMVNGEMEAVVALELCPLTQALLDRATRTTQWGTAWFSRIVAPRDAAVQQGHMDLLISAMGLAAVNGEESSVGQALCTFLANRLGLLRVSLGGADHGPQRVIATSRGELATVRTDFLVALAAALDEAVTAGVTLMWPVPDDQLAAIGAHDRLCRSHDADWAVSVPVCDARLSLVMCFEGQGQAPLPTIVQAWQEMVRLLAPLLALRHTAHLSLAGHAAISTRRLLRDWTLDAPRWRWLVLAGALGGALFLGFAHGEARVAGQATLESAQRQALVAPFDGYLAEALARPGQHVHAGEMLAHLDDRELLLQRLDNRARVAEAERQVSDAIGRREMAQAAIATARRRQSEAELQIIETNIARSRLVAPFDALVIAGDPTQQVGAPLRHGDLLYELSPLDHYRVAIEVEEGDFAEVQPGQVATLLLSALPDDVWALTVRFVTPIATAKDGRTVFRVDADLDDAAPAQAEAIRALLRPGMQGVAKIAIGARRHVWIWTHTMLGWARLKLWAWLP